jgi:PAS domain S-box-containing protein
MNSFNRRLLVVDDNPSIHADFRKILCGGRSDRLDEVEAALFGEKQVARREVQFELDSASQGQEALEMVKEALQENRPYAMAFVDVRMPPGWDGIETIAKIWEVDPHLQVAICTAYSDYSLREIAERLGENPDSFVILKKPFDMIEVTQLANAFTQKWNLFQRMQAAEAVLRQSQADLEKRVAARTEELAAAHVRFEHLLRSSPAIIYSKDGPGNVTFISHNVLAVLGHSSAEFIGQPQFWSQRVHPEDGSVFRAHRSRLLIGEHHSAEYRFQHKDGSYLWLCDEARVVRDATGVAVEIVGSCTDITGRKEIEAALHQSENRYRQLIESQGEGVVLIDGELRFTFANPAAETILGAWSGRLVGRRLDEFLPEREKAIVQKQTELLQAGQKTTYELEIIAGNKERRHVLVTGTPQFDPDRTFRGSFAVFRDITERKKAEEALRQSEERIRLLVASVKDHSIIMLDPAGRVASWNNGAERIEGYKAHEIVGQNFSITYPPEEAEPGRPAQALQLASLQGHVEEQGWRLRKDDSRFWASVVISAVRDEAGKLRGFSKVTRDITERKRAEQERTALEVQLRNAQKLEAVGQLAAGIAHEISTPTQYVGDNTRFLKDSFERIRKAWEAHNELLLAVKNNALTPELIRRVEESLAANDVKYLFDQIPAAIRETLEGIDRVTRIISAMKEFSHPGGKEKSPADLNKAIETTVAVARNEWKCVADVALDLEPSLPAVPCFVGEFNQVILNLIVNAAHAIGDVVKQNPGSRGTITVKTRRDEDHVEIRVADTGTGIPDSCRSRIFEPFFTTKDIGRGTGQGLSIVYGTVVKKHGGQLSFETEVGKGTTFIIRLPITPSPAPADGRGTPAPTTPPPGTGL